MYYLIRMTHAHPEQLAETKDEYGKRVVGRIAKHPTRPARPWEIDAWWERREGAPGELPTETIVVTPYELHFASECYEPHHCIILRKRNGNPVPIQETTAAIQDRRHPAAGPRLRHDRYDAGGARD